jgi:hypothetical protein
MKLAHHRSDRVGARGLCAAGLDATPLRLMVCDGSIGKVDDAMALLSDGNLTQSRHPGWHGGDAPWRRGTQRYQRVVIPPRWNSRTPA